MTHVAFLSEDYTEYLAGLIGAVSDLRDPRALNALIDQAVLSTGYIAINGVAAFGDDAVSRLTSEYRCTNDNKRKVELTLVASTMLESSTLKSQAKLDEVRKMMILAVGESDHFVRQAAVRGLAYFKDEKSQSLLRKLAANDPYVNNSNGSLVYPVREEARKALAGSVP